MREVLGDLQKENCLSMKYEHTTSENVKILQNGEFTIHNLIKEIWRNKKKFDMIWKKLINNKIANKIANACVYV